MHFKAVGWVEFRVAPNVNRMPVLVVGAQDIKDFASDRVGPRVKPEDGSMSHVRAARYKERCSRLKDLGILDQGEGLSHDFPEEGVSFSLRRRVEGDRVRVHG